MLLQLSVIQRAFKRFALLEKMCLIEGNHASLIKRCLCETPQLAARVMDQKKRKTAFRELLLTKRNATGIGEFFDQEKNYS